MATKPQRHPWWKLYGVGSFSVISLSFARLPHPSGNSGSLAVTLLIVSCGAVACVMALSLLHDSTIETLRRIEARHIRAQFDGCLLVSGFDPLKDFLPVRPPTSPY